MLDIIEILKDESLSSSFDVLKQNSIALNESDNVIIGIITEKNISIKEYRKQICDDLETLYDLLYNLYNNCEYNIENNYINEFKKIKERVFEIKHHISRIDNIYDYFKKLKEFAEKYKNIKDFIVYYNQNKKEYIEYIKNNSSSFTNPYFIFDNDTLSLYYKTTYRDISNINKIEISENFLLDKNNYYNLINTNYYDELYNILKKILKKVQNIVEKNKSISTYS